MSRVTSLANMPEQQLNRWIKRIALLFVVVLIAFIAFYAYDRFRMPTEPMVNRQIAAAEAEVQKTPQDVTSRLRLGALYTADKRWDDAASQFDQVLKISQGNRIAILGKGQALYQKGELDAAAATYQLLVDATKGAEFSPVDTQLEEAFYYLGAIALQKGEADKAVEAFTSALKINKTDADALYGLGAAEVAAKHPDKALEPLRNAVLFVPIGWKEPYEALRDAYQALGKATESAWAAAMATAAAGQGDDALAQLKSLAAKDPTPDVYVGIGLVTETQGDLPAAASAYQKALDLDANNAAAGEGLGRVRHESGSTTPATPPPASSPMPSGNNAG